MRRKRRGLISRNVHPVKHNGYILASARARSAQQSSKPARSSHFDSSGIARGTDVDRGFFPLVPNGPIVDSFSNIEALARGTHALSRAVEERGNSGFSPSFRVSINSNEPGPLPQAHGTLRSFFDNSLLPVGGGRSRRKTVTKIKAQTPKGTPVREQQCFGRCEHAARRFVQAPERDGTSRGGNPLAGRP